jgi:pimeloyl-ACP methyl ester carboxylesterase
MPDARLVRSLQALVLLLLIALGPQALAQTPAADPACTANGCLREYHLLGSYPKETLQPYLEAGVSIDNGYSIYTIRYFTNGSESNATVTIPFDQGLQPPAGGWHIVANNHGSIGLDDPCAITGTVAGAGLAGYFGARRLIGVATDYPGLGTPGLHAYLDVQSEGTSVLDALRATRDLAKILAVPISGRFALAGLSQGGHASLAAAILKVGYAPELDIRAIAAAGPATAWEEHWALGAQYSGPHIPIHAMLFYSWSKTYGWKDLPLWTDETASTIDETMTKLCLWAPSGPTILDKLSPDPAKVFHPDFLREYQTRQWSKYKAVQEAFAKNSIRRIPPTTPLRIYQGAADNIEPEAATREMVNTLKANGVPVDYQVVPEGGHTNVAFYFLASKQLRTDDAIAWIRGLLDKP